MQNMWRNKSIEIGILLLIFIGLSGTVFGQKSLALDKSGRKKRIHFMAGDKLRMKLVTKERVGGMIDVIYDSSFVIHGREIVLNEVNTVYTTRPALKYIGNILVIGGTFYLGVDAFNNAVNNQGYLLSYNTPAIVGISVGTGLIMSYFGTRRTVVEGKGNFRIFDTSLAPLDSAQIDTTVADSGCPNGVEAVLTKMDLDGCSWVLMLASGERLEPMNILEFLPDLNENSSAIKVKVEYYETRSASICMVGKTVAITCLEMLK
jgi:hypothetical protein